jgi:hypothetical protein
MAWPMKRPFYSEEMRQHDVGAMKWEESNNWLEKDWLKSSPNSVNFILNSFRLNLCFILNILICVSLVVWTTCWWLIEKMVQIFKYHVHMISIV